MTLPLPTRLLDRERSWAILVGASEYDSPSLPKIPQAITSVEDLGRALTGPTGLFRKEHVITVRDPGSTEDILGPMNRIARHEPDVVLFYYVGHGLQESFEGRGLGFMQLFLSLRGSIDEDADRIRTGLPIGVVFSRLRSLQAEQSVVVLDCCFAGRALDDPNAGDVHVLCATGKTGNARYELTDRHTVFTGALLRLFERGIPDGPPNLDLHTVFHHLSTMLPTTSTDSYNPDWDLERPRQRATDHSGSISFVRNTAFGTALTPEGLAARAEFARRVAKLGDHPLLTVGEQRMLVAHSKDLYASITTDSLGLGPDASRGR